MSESALALDHQSVDLLLNVMETPDAMIAGAVLSDYYEQQADQLMAANLLERCGHELVTTSMADHDDAPVSLTWSAEHNGYGYFSPSAGWITVPDERLVVFGINLPVMLARMMVRFEIASRGGAVSLLPELLWEIGDARVERRSQRVPIWFARRLYDQSVWRQVKDAAGRRPLTHVRVLLTSTPSARLPDEPLPRHLIVPIRDVIDFDGGIAVRPDVLVARLDGAHRPDVREAVYLSPNGQQLIINGDIAIELKSDIHIKVIRQLVQGFKEGKRFGARDLLNHAQSNAATLRQAFGRERWERLEPYLKSRNGLWGFEP